MAYGQENYRLVMGLCHKGKTGAKVEAQLKLARYMEHLENQLKT